MKLENVTHIAKSNYAYNIDRHTLHIRLRTTKDTAHKVAIRFGDPFMWGLDEETNEYKWISESAEDILLTKELSTSTYDYWFCEITSPTKRVKYSFVLNDRFMYGSRDFYDLQDDPDELTNLFNYFNFPILLDVDTYQSPEWIKDTIWYSIFPDRFCNKDNNQEGILPWESVTDYRNDMFFGGNLKGITEKLEYIKEIGCNGLYLNPIFKSPTAHKYDTIDYFEIDESFGTKEDFKELVSKAHKLGIKVMLDAVFNHCSHLHPFFQDVVKKGKDSNYTDCFYIKDYPVINYELDENNMPKRDSLPVSKLNYESFAFTKAMPKLNTEHPIVRDYLLEVGRYWVEEFDIDGWRLDVANEVSHDFWRAFRKELHKVKKDIFILGENWDNSLPWLQGDQFDAVMNYEFMYPIWSYFGTNIDTKKYSGQRFVDKINNVLFSYPKHTITNMFNIIDSHDTARILNICDENVELVKTIYTFQYSLPGAPSIYYGGEIGLTGKHDPDNRRCMIWDKSRHNQNLLEHIQRLSKLYHEYDAFKSANLKWVSYSDDYLIYEKEDLLFVINKSNRDISVTTIPNGAYTDVLTNIDYNVIDTFKIPSFRGLILKKKAQ